ncbi:MAG TPA: murein biosynthesis integral membrane protein MurJ [Patescibacteria group bacterium]|nr:murein biosynthesis integral membrane protein MurJ [Patescibacteria group bacterium]
MIEPTDVSPAEQTLIPATLSDDPAIVRAVAVLAIGNVVSRILGLLREIVKSNMFGTSDLLAAYTVAVLVPMTLFNLISGGEMVSSSLVPVFSDYAAKEKRPELWRVVSILLSLATIILILLVILVELLAPLIAFLAGARNFSDPLLIPVTVQMMRLATPAVLFLSIASILTGVLLSLKRFTLPAFTTAVFNGTIVVVTLLRPDKISSLVWGLLLGSILQVLMLLPGLRDGKFRLDFNWRHSAIRRIIILYTPIVLGLLVNQIAIWISYNLAITTGDNSVTYMTYATTLYQFPLGLVVTALSVATLPTLSRLASAYQLAVENHAPDAAEKLNDYKETLAGGLRLVIVLGIPAAVGLFVLAQPIIALLLEHGAFTAADTEITARVLRIYLIGLGFAAVDQMLVFASYARKDTWRPALVGVISIIIYVATAALLLKPLGLLSLMVADAVKHIVHTAIMLLIFQRQLGGLAGYRIAPSLFKSIIAALITGIAAFGAEYFIVTLVPSDTFLGKLIIVLTAGFCGLATYFAVVFALDIEDAKSLWYLVIRKMRRSKPK